MIALLRSDKHTVLKSDHISRTPHSLITVVFPHLGDVAFFVTNKAVATINCIILGTAVSLLKALTVT